MRRLPLGMLPLHQYTAYHLPSLRAKTGLQNKQAGPFCQQSLGYIFINTRQNSKKYFSFEIIQIFISSTLIYSAKATHSQHSFFPISQLIIADTQSVY